MKKSFHKPKLCSKKESKKPKRIPKTEEQLKQEWIMARRAMIYKHQKQAV
jgi:hypothetical protein